MTPLQAELLEDGVVPDPDGLGRAMGRADIAPEAGYYEDGPMTTPEPGCPPEHEYAAWPPVFQWEIDPTDPSLESGTAQVTLDFWEHSIWWQRHPAGLCYASIQALRDDPTALPERLHPVGRNVAVNIVYDEARQGVVAVYGTARDFRPFIEAFRIGFGLQPASEPGANGP